MGTTQREEGQYWVKRRGHITKLEIGRYLAAPKDWWLLQGAGGSYKDDELEINENRILSDDEAYQKELLENKTWVADEIKDKEPVNKMKEPFFHCFKCNDTGEYPIGFNCECGQLAPIVNKEEVREKKEKKIFYEVDGKEYYTTLPYIQVGLLRSKLPIWVSQAYTIYQKLDDKDLLLNDNMEIPYIGERLKFYTSPPTMNG